jgi:cysteinyl-tRNA synthetase
MDFVLWKPSKPGEPAWPSPCGITAPGRPGWHIECSAMSDKWLWGEAVAKLSASGRAHPHQFDIHGGGIDLVFPHHENEIAQSRSAFHTPAMANFWMHNGFLQVEGEKMSKSLGNFVTIHELLTSENFGGSHWSEAALRLAMLRTHYRQPIDWTVRSLEEAERAFLNWANILEKHQTSFVDEEAPPDEVLGALADDLNTPMALAEMHKLAESARKGDLKSAQELHRSAKFFVSNKFFSSKDLANVGRSAGQLLPAQLQLEIESKVDARSAARARKDWGESDRIRDELAKMGVVLKDSKDGTTWEIAR